MITTLNECINKSLKTKSSREHDCDITLHIDGVPYVTYTVSIANRDIMFYTDTAVITYDVDTYGDRSVAVLRDLKKDDE